MLVAGDVQHNIVDVVTATGTDSSTTSAWSNLLGPVNSAAANLTPPVISGIPRVGRTLHSTTGTWSNAASYAYQWYSCTDAPSGSPASDSACTTVGTNRPTYDLVKGDVHHRIVDIVTATGTDASTTSQRSNLLGPVLEPVRKHQPKPSTFHLRSAVFFGVGSTALTRPTSRGWTPSSR